MTGFSKAKALEIVGLDQALLYTIVSLERANRAYDNYEWNRDPTLPVEAQEDVNWSIVKDDNGLGRIVFKAIIPLSNRHPFLGKRNIVSQVRAFTNYYSNEIDDLMAPNPSGSIPKPPILENIVTLEQYVVWLSLLANAYREYVLIYNGNLDTPTAIADNVLSSFQTGNVSSFEAIGNQLNVANLGAESAPATGWEFMYERQGYDNLVPQWYLDSLQNYDGSRAIGTAQDNPQINSVGDNPVQALETCKEQDANATEYGSTGIIQLWEIIKDGKQ
jgi:hypothetical protein